MHIAPAKRRRLLVPGLASLIGTILLLMLGQWQLHRYKVRQAIIDGIEARAAAPPVALPAHPGPFEKVFVHGTWLAGKAALYGDVVHDSPSGEIRGAELIMPLARPDGSIVLVDLGWVPQTMPAPLAQPRGPVDVAGYVHAPVAPGWFSAKPDFTHNLYYVLDPRTIAQGLGLSNVAPFILVAMGPPPARGWPLAATRLPHPANNSYQYALTWFGLAIVLVFEFGFFAYRVLTEPPARPDPPP